MNTYSLLSVLATLTFLGAACNKPATTTETKQEQHSDESPTRIVSLTKAQVQSIGITLGTLEKKQLTQALKANGLLKVPNQNRATVNSAIGGIVKSIRVQAGQQVRKGQVIATLYSQDFITLQEEYLTVKAKHELATLDYTRQKNLNEGSATALKVYQQVETEMKTLLVRKSSLERQLEHLGLSPSQLTPQSINDVMEITAPLAGAISTVLVNIGTHVDPNNSVAEIVDNRQLHVDLYVYERDLAQLHVGQTIHFTQTNNPGIEYDARIFSVSNTFEPQTKAITVHAEVEGKKDNLIDGMSVSAVISLQKALLVAVPDDAIVNYQGQDFVFIERHDTDSDSSSHDGHHNSATKTTGTSQSKDIESDVVEFERIPIRKGTSDVGYTEITALTTIPLGSRVVTKGAFFILAKMTNQGGEHEH